MSLLQSIELRFEQPFADGKVEIAKFISPFHLNLKRDMTQGTKGRHQQEQTRKGSEDAVKSIGKTY